ncbi:hypothetical protein RUND412_011311, partial [Rhizina undulata]
TLNLSAVRLIFPTLLNAKNYTMGYPCLIWIHLEPVTWIQNFNFVHGRINKMSSSAKSTTAESQMVDDEDYNAKYAKGLSLVLEWKPIRRPQMT